MSPHASPSANNDDDGDTRPHAVPNNLHATSELTPLISNGSKPSAQPRKDVAHRSDVDIPINVTAAVNVPKKQTVVNTDTILYVIILFCAGSAGLWTIPATRQVEDVVCRQHYEVLEPIDEDRCKEDAIQSRVAMVFAIYSALQATIAAASAVPWGIVADRVGRKMVFSLAVLGMMLDQLWFLLVCAFPWIFPLNAMWFGSSLQVVGGGNLVVSAVIFSMLTDITTSENRLIWHPPVPCWTLLTCADRARKFMAAHLSSMIGNLGSPIIAGWMMEKTGPWPVMWVSLFGFATMGYTIHLIPETRPAAQASLDTMADEPVISTPQYRPRQLKELLSLIKLPSLVLLLVTMLTLFPITLSTYQFMIIFASRRYQISTSQTGFLSFFYGFSVIVVIIAILPGVSKLLSSPKTPKALRFSSSNKRDLFLARVSSAILLLGSFCLAVSPNVNAFTGGLVLLSLGSGWGSYARSLCALYVDSAHRTQLYSITSLIETAGMIYAQPMLAGLFGLGMDLGGFWIGLPYLGCACFCAASLGLLLLVRLPAPEGGDHHASDDNVNNHSPAA
ncbi:Putative major facilitator superfamily, MFS transporter superfamily [Colletotrichum destructivum]|uniref:Major facilitator superfamily, MFS transporter superfamily n=1 Tax=Colletotrichum destructivum TaxID=34406 RepID=A0AAX4J3F4_9PEZI|nr:Putative major facilitator superfamily, MFS transporter superfamily [Colletotrichum destructivum]